MLCGHRFYDPANGRWLTRDPMGYEGGINLYAYCGNQPMDRADPAGLIGFGDGNLPGFPVIGPTSGGIYLNGTNPVNGFPISRIFGPGGITPGPEPFQPFGPEPLPMPMPISEPIDTTPPTTMGGDPIGRPFDGGRFLCKLVELNPIVDSGPPEKEYPPEEPAPPGITRTYNPPRWGNGGTYGGPGWTGIVEGGESGGGIGGGGEIGGGGIGGGGEIGGGGCFVAGTPVIMADGSPEPIDQVKKGDLVLSRDQTTGQISGRKVIATLARRVKGSLVLRFSNGETLETTGEHPFYIVGTGFVHADKLVTGMVCMTRSGQQTRVTEMEPHWERSPMVYNFRVEAFHTYFVGRTGILVHNGPITKTP